MERQRGERVCCSALLERTLMICRWDGAPASLRLTSDVAAAEDGSVE